MIIQTANISPLLANLTAGKLDIGLFILGDYPNAHAWQVETSWEMELVVVGARPDLPARCAIKALAEQPFILPEQGNQIQTVVDTYLSNLGFQPKVMMRLGNPEAIKALVKAQLGLSLLPYWMVDEDLRRGELHRIRLRETPLICQVGLATRRTKVIPAPVRAFLEVAREIKLTRPRLVSR